jgi:hypothetical protein
VGECECFDGYEGKACGRQTCPNDCSGHGTCEYVEETGFGSTPGAYWDGSVPTKSGIFTQGSVAGGKTFSPYMWDKGMSRVCVCDPQYTEVDCSRRMCPKANDVMDERHNTADALKYQVQNITLFMDGTYGNGTFSEEDFDRSDFDDKTFALTFKSTINETFTTIPLKFNQSTFDKSTVVGPTDAKWRPPFAYFAGQVKAALENLPNKVIDEVDVDVSMAYSYSWGLVGDTPNTATGSNTEQSYLNIEVTFKGPAVSGPQNLLMVNADLCGDGCTPKLTGMDLKSWDDSTQYIGTNNGAGMMSFVSEKVAADYNNYECGRRGKCDYSDGTCECFSGFTGEACATQTALV